MMGMCPPFLFPPPSLPLPPSLSPSHLTSTSLNFPHHLPSAPSRRALASSNVDGTCAMFNNARFNGFCGCGLVAISVLCSRTLLEEDYRDVLESRLKASLPVSTAGSVSQCVVFPPPAVVSPVW